MLNFSYPVYLTRFLISNNSFKCFFIKNLNVMKSLFFIQIILQLDIVVDLHLWSE